MRWAFISVALWWGGFTVLTLLWLPEEKAADADDPYAEFQVPDDLMW